MAKRIIALLLSLLMITAVFPFAAFVTVAEDTTIENYAEGSYVAVANLSSKELLGGGSYRNYNSGGLNVPYFDGKNSWKTSMYVYNLANVRSIKGNYAENINQAYCIEHTVPVSTEGNYYGYLPGDSKYFNSLMDGDDGTKLRGILLTLAFGYPTIKESEWRERGFDNINSVIASTQALIWEFQCGNRTDFTSVLSGDDLHAFSMIDHDADSVKVYWRILNDCQDWINAGGDWRYLLEDSELIVWEQSDSGSQWEDGSAQTLITYTGDGAYDPRGSISVLKTDEDGNPLQGAEFTIVKPDETIFAKLVTDENGYAITEGGTEYPSVPFGKYTVKETGFPTYTNSEGKVVEYKPDGQILWTAEITPENRHEPFKIKATNRKDVFVKITKTYEGSIDYASFVDFVIYDNVTNEKLLTLTTNTVATDKVASTQTVVLPITESKEYRVEEITTGPYDCYMKNGSDWVKMESYVFKYDDVAHGSVLQLDFKNIPHKGYAQIRKQTSDNSPLDNFYFEITKPNDSSFVKITGYTNSEGYLINDNGLIELEPGEYLLTEILTDEQAQKFVEPVPITFSIESDKTTPITYTNTPSQSSIRIIKKSQDGIVIGAKFLIEGVLADGKTFSKVCTVEDSSGIIFITEDDNGQSVVAGTYTITEIEVDGRYMQPQSQTIAITPEDDGKTIDVSFYNELKPINIAVIKTSEDNIINNITFVLFGNTITGRHIVHSFKTDENGIAVPNNLDILPGTYTIAEAKIEGGRYVTQKTIYVKLYVDSEGNAHYTDVDGKVHNTESYTDANGNTVNALVFRFHNVLKKFELTLNKVNGLYGTSVSYGDATLEGAVYGLYKDGVLVESKATDINGKVTFSVQVCGTGYTVKEISPSVGFYLDQTVYTVEADAPKFEEEYNDISITVNEEPVLGTISINKLIGTETDNVPEIGAQFYIYLKEAGSFDNADNYERDILVTKLSEGIGAIATSKELPYGTYVIHQISGDERFAFVDDFEVVIDSSNEHLNATYTLLNEITVKPVTVTKKDITGQNTIPGAVFVLEDSHGRQIQGTTDENGEIEFTVMPSQTFKLYEICAPEGYSLNDTPVTFTLDIYGKVINGTTEIRNEPNRYVVKKTDTLGNTLSGATFEMKNVETGEVFATITTGVDGLAIFEKIPFGNYVVKEIEAPAGYKLTDKVIELNIDGTYRNLGVGEINANFVNEDIVVVLEKVDADTLQGIAGAEITIKDEKGNVYKTELTDVNGQIVLNNLPAGKYTFQETYAPEGYELNVNVFSFEVDEYGVVSGDATILDEFNRYVVKKTDTLGNALSGATFEMKNVETGEVFATLVSGIDGTVLFKNIPFGTYEIREIKAPAGYKLSAEVITVTIDGNWKNLPEGQFDGTIINEPTNVVINKTDTLGNTLSGAEITVYDENNNKVAFGKTNEQGQFIVFNLVAGKYTFQETYAPNGYELNSSIFTFEILEDGSFVGDDTITNNVNKYVIKKVDGNGEPLADATFEMKNVETGEVFATVTTGADGLAIFTSIPYGNYVVKEIEAPAGYKLTDKEFAITVDGTWVNEEDEINDILVNNNTQVIISKTDTLGNALSGAEITVYDSEGKEYFVGVTDENGNLTVDNIIVGRYTFKETKAPEGYELNVDVFSFEVDEYGVVTGTTTLSDNYNKYVVKKTDKDGNPLANAIFEMKNVETGEVFATITTGADGLAVFEKIPFGNYIVYEKQSPAGYKLSDTVLEVTINDTWVNLPEGDVNGTIENEDTVVILTKTEITTGAGIPNATITVYDANGNIYAEGKSDVNGEFAIYNIIPGKYTFKETYAPNGYEINTMTFKFEVTAEGEVIGGTNITDKPNKYVVLKTDKDGNSLANATFVMKNVDTDEIFATVVTGADGLAIFTSIPYGNYVIYESKAPAGYKLSDKVIELVVDGTYENLGEGEFNDTVVNEDTVLVIDKTDASTGEAVSNAEIVIYDADGNVYFEGVTDKNGLITIYNIIPGKYTWCEIKAPAGYKLNKTVFEFEVTIEGEIIGDTSITNEPTKVVIKKTDTIGNALADTKISIYNVDGEVVFEGTTNEKGEIDVSYLPAGEYTFQETYAPNGYEINTTTFKFVIDTEGNVTGEDTVIDDVVKVVINKINDKKEPLANVEFTVYDVDGNIVTSAITDENGQVVFEGLRWGEYTIKETKTADGYYLSTDSIVISVDGTWVNGSETAVYEVVNHPILQTGDMSDWLMWAILMVVTTAFAMAVFRKRII